MGFMLLYQLLARASQVSLLGLVKKFSANTEVLLSERYLTAIMPEVILHVQNLAFFYLLKCIFTYSPSGNLFSITLIFGEPLAKIEQFVGSYFVPEVCETGKNTEPTTCFLKKLLLEYIRIKRL